MGGSVSAPQGMTEQKFLREIADFYLCLDEKGRVLGIEEASHQAKRYIDSLREVLLTWRFLPAGPEESGSPLESRDGSLTVAPHRRTVLHLDLPQEGPLNFRGEFIQEEEAGKARYHGYFIRVHADDRTGTDQSSFEAFFHRMAQMLLVMDAGYRIIFANGEVIRRTGYSFEALKGMRICDLLSLEGVDCDQARLKALCEGCLTPCEMTMTARDGGLIRVRMQAHDGQWEGSPCIYCLASELTADEAALYRFEKIFQKCPDLLVILDGATQEVIDGNETFYRTTGYLPEEIVGRHIDQLAIIHPVKYYKILKNELVRKGFLHEKEVTLRLKSDQLYDVVLNVDRVQHHDRAYWVIFMLPIGRLKSLRGILENKSRERSILLNNIGTQVWYLIDAYTYGKVNRAHARFLGLKTRDLSHQDMRKVLDKALVAVFGLPDFETGAVRRTTSEVWVDPPGGGSRCLAIRRTPVHDLQGNLQYVVCSAEDITESILDKHTLQAREAEFWALISRMNQGIAVFKAVPDQTEEVVDFKITQINHRFAEMMGHSRDRILGSRLLEREREARLDWFGVMKQVAREGTTSTHVEFYPGTGLWLQVTVYRPLPGHVAVMLNDITLQKSFEENLHIEKERLRMTLLSVGDGVITSNEGGEILLMNQVAQELTGWPAGEACGREITEVFQIRTSQSGMDKDLFKTVLATNRSFDLDSHRVLVPRTGEDLSIEGGIHPIRDESGAPIGLVVVFRNTAKKREEEKKIEYLSFHDYLTGLYNRRYVEESLSRLDTLRNLPLTLMSLDVNGLKLTNDAFGHQEGDRLLKIVAGILTTSLREDEIIGRIGGDEFMILLPATTPQEADHLRERILQATRVKCRDPLVISLAVGHATKTSPAEDIEEIKRLADQRMYEDKLENGKFMRLQTVEMLLRLVKARFSHESMHVLRVTRYAEAIARGLGLSREEIDNVRSASELHEIGMVMIPQELISKQGPLTEKERRLMELHTKRGYQILRSVDEYSHLADFILHHHEFWDGSGYPEGLQKDEIPLCSRIIAVANAYEAMTALRPYRRRMTMEEALGEIRQNSGSQFDPRVVAVFVKLLHQKGFDDLA